MLSTLERQARRFHLDDSLVTRSTKEGADAEMIGVAARFYVNLRRIKAAGQQLERTFFLGTVQEKIQ